MANSRKCREATEAPYFANGTNEEEVEESSLKTAHTAEQRTRVRRLPLYQMWLMVEYCTGRIGHSHRQVASRGYRENTLF